MSVDTQTRNASQLTLQIWHPDCWTLQSTEAVDAGLVAHGVYQTDEVVNARLTAYADARDDIDELVDVIDQSPLTSDVKEINEYFNPSVRTSAAGNATQELLVTYESSHSIYDAFISRGFVPDSEIRIHDGNEYWTVIISEDRQRIQERLDEIREEMQADIAIEGMKSPNTQTCDTSPKSALSERQREVFELAQRRGYYSWPRQTSASNLADELDVSKTTLLEHLRKAESKLLNDC
jgi:hypothetical protein